MINLQKQQILKIEKMVSENIYQFCLILVIKIVWDCHYCNLTLSRLNIAKLWKKHKILYS